MIDVSDGLVADLNHILEESGAGAILYEAKIPISARCKKVGTQNRFISTLPRTS